MSERLRRAAEVEAQVAITAGPAMSGNNDSTGVLDPQPNRYPVSGPSKPRWNGAPITDKDVPAARYEVEWDPEQRGLSVVVSGGLFIGLGATLEIRWTRNGAPFAEARSANDLTLPFLASPDQEPPRLGDRLEFRHQKNGPNCWDILLFTVEL
jgi:hypothetical protein